MRKQKRPYQRPTMTVYPFENKPYILVGSGGGEGPGGSIPRSLIYDDEPLKA